MGVLWNIEIIMGSYGELGSIEMFWKYGSGGRFCREYWMELLGKFGSIVLGDLGSMEFWEIFELWNYCEILKV